MECSPAINLQTERRDPTRVERPIHGSRAATSRIGPNQSGFDLIGADRDGLHQADPTGPDETRSDRIWPDETNSIPELWLEACVEYNMRHPWGRHIFYGLTTWRFDYGMPSRGGTIQ